MWSTLEAAPCLCQVLSGRKGLPVSISHLLAISAQGPFSHSETLFLTLLILISACKASICQAETVRIQPASALTCLAGRELVRMDVGDLSWLHGV
jgi:hypothetical protein